nr:hypothetical protein BaRGS_032185 [Batillaria attramentaria]
MCKQNYDGEERSRHAKSAPSRKDQAPNNNGGAPLPKINSLMARSRGPGSNGEQGQPHVLTTAFAGVSTKSQDSHFRSNKFASSWAQVRAENHLDVSASTEHPKQSPRDGSQDAADRSRDRSRNDKSVSPYRNQQQKSSPERRKKGDNRRGDALHAQSHDKENVQPQENSAPAQNKGPGQSQTHKSSQSPPNKSKGEKKEKQEIRFITPDDEERDEESVSPFTGDTDISSLDNRDDHHAEDAEEPRRKPQWKPAWDNRLTLKPADVDVKVKSLRRYEAELTHQPAVTSTDQVYTAYTGRKKHQLRDRSVDRSPDTPRTRPPTKDSHTTDDSKTSDPSSRYSKDYILSRNEAKMYIHIRDVYGSEAFRHQRKEHFFKKISDLQQQEEKHQAQDRRRAQQRREESKRRQQRQLMYVRRKFRKQQLHRFRTQYVTSRVLEYERADRDLYGLPGDSDSDDFADEYGYSKDEGESPKNAGAKDSKDDVGASTNKGPADDNIAKQGDSRKEPNTGNTKNAPKASTNQQRVNGSDVLGGGKGSSNVNDEKGGKAASKKTDKENKTETKKSTANGVQAQKPSTDTNDRQTEASKSEARTSKENANKASKKDTKSKPENTQEQKKTGVSGEKTDPQKSDGSRLNGTVSEKDKIPPKTKDSDVNLVSKDMSKDGATNKKPQAKNTSKDSAPKPETTGKPSNAASTTQHSTTTPQITKENAGTTNNKTAQRTTLPNGQSNGHSSQEKPVAASKAKPSDKTDKAKPGTQAVIKPEQGRQPDNEATKGAVTGKGNAVSEKNNAVSDKNNAVSEKNNAAREKNNAASEKTKAANEKNKNAIEKNNAAQTETTRLDSKADAKPAGQTAEEGNRGSEVSKPVVAGGKESEKERETGVPGKRTTIKKDAKGRYITTTKVFGSNATPAADTTRNNDNKQSHSDKKGDTAEHTAHTGRARSDSRGRKRKPAHAQPLTEAEQKKQLERKYGKMFDVSTGPQLSKPPKMEGIDTVMVKETDSKGRTRTRKREVKDVVKEAKKAAAAPTDPDSPGRSQAKSGPKGANRPPSADTLDFDDEDDDEDDDVFERLRKKYNLQIDSDDD